MPKTIIKTIFFRFRFGFFPVTGFQFFLICSVPVNRNLQKFWFFPVLIWLQYCSSSGSLISGIFQDFEGKSTRKFEKTVKNLFRASHRSIWRHLNFLYKWVLRNFFLIFIISFSLQLMKPACATDYSIHS